MVAARPSFFGGEVSGMGRPKPKGSVNQSLSPTEIARRQGIAGQQMADYFSPARNQGGTGVAAAQQQARQRQQAAQQREQAMGASPGGYSSTQQGAQPLASGPPAQLRSGSGADGNPQFALAAVNNTPGAQNAGSGIPEHGTDIANWTFDGSGTAFSPRDLETMLNDPYAFQRQFLQSRGMNTPGANAALGQYASRLNPLSMILGGANMAPGDQGNMEALAEIYEGLLDNYTTPGGRMPDVGEIMAILAGVQNIENGGTGSSLLQSLLAGEDPEGQVSAIQQILGASLAGMPGLWGRAWSNTLDNAGTAYLDSTMDSAQGPNATFVDYLRNDPFLSRVR